MEGFHSITHQVAAIRTEIHLVVMTTEWLAREAAIAVCLDEKVCSSSLLLSQQHRVAVSTELQS